MAAVLLEGLEEAPDGTSALPDERITKSQFRILRSLIYGIDTFRGLFNERQLYVLGTFCEAVRAAHAEMIGEGMEYRSSDALATYLGFCVDRIADRNSSFCTWGLIPVDSRRVSEIPSRSRPFAWRGIMRRSIRFSKVSGSWDGAVRWIEASNQALFSNWRGPAEVKRGDAQHLSFPDGTFDAVIVDPPYYDAFQYGDLSDFFYVWLKRSIGHLHPDALRNAADAQTTRDYREPSRQEVA